MSLGEIPFQNSQDKLGGITLALLDETGYRILEELRLDGRLSFRELGRRVGLSTAATAERVRRMEDEGIIKGFTIQVDLDKLGFPIRAILALSADYNNPMPLLDGTMEQLPEVLRWWRVTGRSDYFIEVAARSLKHLEDILVLLTRHGKVDTSVALALDEPLKIPFPDKA